MKHLIRCICIFAMLSMMCLSGCTRYGTENKKPSQSDTFQRAETGAENQQTSLPGTAPNDKDDSLTETNEEAMTVQAIEIIVDGQKFEISLYDNETARAFANTLPLTLEMKELNGNEKYHYLDKPLPTDSSRVESISCGDLMLYGSDCIVLFYKKFSTPYSYTKIGKVNDPEGLEQVLGKGSVTITFQIK